MKGSRNGSAAFVTILIVIILVIAGGIWYYEAHKAVSSSATSISSTTTSSPQAPTSTPNSAVTTFKTVGWVDPQDNVYGFHFNVPSSWIEQPNGNERSMLIYSCSYNTSTGCDFNTMIQLQMQVNPPDSGDTLVIANYTKQGETILSSSTIMVGGVPAQAVVGLFPPSDSGPNLNVSSSITASLLFEKDSVQYLATISGNQAVETQMKPIVADMLSSFAFEAPQAQQPPAEYQLLENMAGWTLTYQDQDTRALVCSDGSTGTMPQGYAFTMDAKPYDGDINTPYSNVVAALQSNGWTQCNSSVIGSGATQTTVFQKADRLIAVARSYSTGVGNSLAVQIQY
jgi:hypothetical protein